MSGIRCFLCSRVALRRLSVGAHLAARRLSQCLGWQELASLKHHATCFQALLGCSLCLPTLPFRPWRGITFCNEEARRIVILNTAPPDFAGEPLLSFAAIFPFQFLVNKEVFHYHGNVGVVNDSVELIGLLANGKQGNECARVVAACP